ATYPSHLRDAKQTATMNLPVRQKKTNNNLIYLVQYMLPTVIYHCASIFRPLELTQLMRGVRKGAQEVVRT
ncbi:hypothetical protein, partial [Acinetobacter baumannii]|uniref:hypothetical protein n=1 Tax=Acinetobacter baumannii TaxID=470 RepID=UPI001C074D9F